MFLGNEHELLAGTNLGSGNAIIFNYKVITVSNREESCINTRGGNRGVGPVSSDSCIERRGKRYSGD